MPEPNKPNFRKVESSRQTQRRRALADWRGIYVPPDLKRFEKRVADLIPRVMEKTGAADRVGHTQIADAWEQIVGTYLHKHSRPVALRRGTLIVAVTQAPIRYDLERHHRPGILARLQEKFPAAGIRSVKFQNG